jgi:hypothetical protein
MAADLSRRTFNPVKRYVAVQAQQGRVLTDADLNEQVDIGRYRTAVEAIDTIGPCGIPKATDGFSIGVTPDGGDLTISPGRVYVDGLLCELLAARVPVTFDQTLADTEAIAAVTVVDDRPLDAGQWVEIAADERPQPLAIRIVTVDTGSGIVTFDADVSSYRTSTNPRIRRVTTYTLQPDLPNPDFTKPATSPPGAEALDLVDGRYLVYVKAWHHDVDAIDDPHIKEVALGGPDTGTRLKTVWQVQLLKVADNGAPTCATAFPEWETLRAPATGQLTARAAATGAPTLCEMPPSAGFRRLENQLYRVQIHASGDLDHATFKWSRENGSVRTGITITGSTIVADDLGKDDVLGFKGGDWVEIVDDVAALKEAPNDLLQIDTPDIGTREITTAASLVGLSERPNLRMQLWNQSGAVATANGVAMSGDWIELEDGVQVKFSSGDYRSGDYWLIPARTATRDVEWPPFQNPNTHPFALPPVGISRHYCKLALVTVSGGAVIAIDDCRATFPPLTAITATDVSYQPIGCDRLPGVETVQEALDALCRSGTGACTLVASTADSLQALFDRIPQGGDAEVCFPIGAFTLPKPVEVKGKGHLKLVGSGPGTRLVAANDEAALRFERCDSVIVREMSVEAGRVNPAAAAHLNGALTFAACPVVDVEGVWAKCASGGQRAATCITITGADLAQSATPVVQPAARVVNCRLDVGTFQTGLLLVDPVRADVRDNAVRAAAAQVPIATLLRDARFRATVRRQLLGRAIVGSVAPAGGVTNAKVQFGGHTVLFNTPPLLKDEWQTILNAKPPAQNATGPQVLAQLKRRVDELLTSKDARAISQRFGEWFAGIAKADLAPPPAFQGIVVGGTTAQNVRIADNTIEGVLQGVHVGVSHRTAVGQRATDVAGAVWIARNTIVVRLTPDSGKRERHGIFVGNARSVAVEDNVVSIQRDVAVGNIAIEGARLFGFLGPRAIVRHNHFVGPTIGVTMMPHPPFFGPTAALWLIADNVFESVPLIAQVNLPKPPPPAIVVAGNKGFA